MIGLKLVSLIRMFIFTLNNLTYDYSNSKHITRIKKHNRKTIKSEQITKNLNAVVEIIFNAFSEGNKILLCGNGGSASDAQHIAAELTGRFFKDRTVHLQSITCKFIIHDCCSKRLWF